MVCRTDKGNCKGDSALCREAWSARKKVGSDTGTVFKMRVVALGRNDLNSVAV